MIRLLRPLLIIIIFWLFLFWTNIKYNWTATLSTKISNFKTNLAISNTWENKNFAVVEKTWVLFSWKYEATNNIQTDILSNLQKSVSWNLLTDNTWNLYTWISKNPDFNFDWKIIDITWQNIFLIKLVTNLPKIQTWSIIQFATKISCKFIDQTIKNWDYIIAYRQKYSIKCDFEKRYCDNGKLYGKYVYDTCIYWQMPIAIVLSNLSWNKNTNPSFIYTSGDTKSIIVTSMTGKIKSDNITNIKRKLVDDYDDVNKYINEFANNFVNDWVNDSVSNRNNNWNSQDDESINSGNIKDFSIKKSLENRQKKVDEIMSDNRSLPPKKLEEYIALMKPKNNETWSAGPSISTEYISQNIPSTSQNKKSCKTPRGTNINNWQFITAYQSPSTIFPKICQFETRYCDDGKLWWTFWYQNCEFWQLEYNTKLDTTSYYLYSDNSNIFHPNYIAKPIWIWFYLINSSIWHPTPNTPWCRINNIYIPNWKSKIFYKYTNMNWSESCNWIYRKCEWWQLGWDSSYGYIYCRQKDPISCRAPWYNTYIPHGSSKIYYNWSSSSCNYEYRYCNNWNLWWSYTNINQCN